MDVANQAKALIILDDLKKLENLKQEFEKLRPNRLLLTLSIVGITNQSCRSYFTRTLRLRQTAGHELPVICH
jgi:hypothetical protein